MDWAPAPGVGEKSGGGGEVEKAPQKGKMPRREDCQEAVGTGCSPCSQRPWRSRWAGGGEWCKARGVGGTEGWGEARGAAAGTRGTGSGGSGLGEPIGGRTEVREG